MEEDTLVTARRSAMNFLARREHSFQELLVKLDEKHPDMDRELHIIPALERLREENLQSDERFLESYIRFRRNKGFGPLKIDSELQGRGLDTTAINSALNSGEHDWFLQCKSVLLKRFPDPLPDSIKEKAKRQRFLMQRGFSSDDIRHALEAGQE